MNSRLIYAAFWLIFAVWNFYDWRRNKDKDLVWFGGICTVGFIGELIYYYSIVINAPRNTLSAIDYYLKVFDIIAVVAMIFFGVRHFGKKRD